MRTSFSGHETFPLRSGWLKKAVDAVLLDPKVFSSEDAIATFGVGKNMVRSIRHWSVLAGVIQHRASSRLEYEATELGQLIFSQKGGDPYFEDEATSWLLHWQIVKNIEQATLWHYLFGIYRASSIDAATLFPEFKHWLNTRGVTIPSDATLKRDFLCIGNSYAPKHSRRSIEDTLQCPLSGIGLLVRKDGSIYSSQRHKYALPTLVFGAIVLDYWSRRSDGATLALDVFLREEGSPGMLFMLSEDVFYELVTAASFEERVPFTLEESTGIKQLIKTEEETSIIGLLSHYYLESQVESGVYA
jgi:hypothetical protein